MRFAVFTMTVGIVNGVWAAEMPETNDIRQCLEATADAASREDLEAYVACFDPRLRSQIRKTAGLRFAQFEVAVSIDDFHVISSNETSCDVAVRYTTHLSERSFDFLSVLALKRADDGWKIRKESIQGWQESTVAESPFPYGGGFVSTAAVRSSCSSGFCSLSGR